jgi:hypothetical protein
MTNGGSVFPRICRRASLSRSLVLLAVVVLAALPSRAQAGRVTDNIVSDHVRVILPTEREWFGREVVPELERCWQFMFRATGQTLPRKIVVSIDWEGTATTSDPMTGAVGVGLGSSAAVRDRRGYIVHAVARETARVGLIGATLGGVLRADMEGVIGGMSEILAHEYDQTIRTLNGAWAIAYLMDRVQALALSRTVAMDPSPAGVHDLHSASPWITFLLTAREVHGRERLQKFFEALRKLPFEQSFTFAFKTPISAMEESWLKKVRSYALVDADATAPEDAPTLRAIQISPDPVSPGSTLDVRLEIEDRGNDILQGGVYLHEPSGGRVFVGRPLTRNTTVTQFLVRIPVGAQAAAGPHSYAVTAIDEAGNIRNWNASYTVR